MSTRKSVDEINLILSELLDKEFKHRGEICDYLDIHMETLRKWVKVSKYTWDDFNINYNKSLRQKIIERGGIVYLTEKFNSGWQVKDIAEDLNSNPVTTNIVVDRFLEDNGLNKYDLNYKKHPPKKTDYMFSLINDKGGIPYLLSSKMNGMSINDVVDDIGNGITRLYIGLYLEQFNLTYTSLNTYNNVYYIPHLDKWRGTIIINDKVYDTGLYDNIYDALNHVDELKNNI